MGRVSFQRVRLLGSQLLRSPTLSHPRRQTPVPAIRTPPGALGLVFGTFMGTSTAMIVNNGIGIWLHEVPNDIWPIFPPIVTGERLIITVAGTILGLAIIAGLRRLRLVKPTEGVWYQD